MTREQFQEATRRVAKNGVRAVVAFFFAMLLVEFALLLWTFPLKVELEAWIRTWAPHEALAGIIAAFFLSIFLVPIFALQALLPYFWADRRFGLKCPHCGRSVTLRRPEEVLQSGRCRHCQQVLFDVPDPASERMTTTAPFADKRRSTPTWVIVTTFLLIAAGLGVQVIGRLLVGEDRGIFRNYVFAGVGLHLIGVCLFVVYLLRKPKQTTPV